MTDLSLDVDGYRALPPPLRAEVDAWLARVAPPEVARNTYAVQVLEDGVAFGYYLEDCSGHRYVANPGDPRELRFAARAWKKIEWCELPPEQAFRCPKMSS